jgi:hypothetical protein
MAVAYDRMEYRRLAERIEHAAARLVERMRQAEHLARLHFLERGQAPPGGQQIQPPALIVFPELAPVRSLGTVFPALGHV